MTPEELLAKHGIVYPPCGFAIDDGWMPIVDRAFAEMIALGWDRCLSQVKEKFGGLRIYIGSASEEVFDVIHRAEEEAWLTCSRCGSRKDVETQGPGWLVTLCGQCRNQQ